MCTFQVEAFISLVIVRDCSDWLSVDCNDWLSVGCSDRLSQVLCGRSRHPRFLGAYAVRTYALLQFTMHERAIRAKCDISACATLPASRMRSASASFPSISCRKGARARPRRGKTLANRSEQKGQESLRTFEKPLKPVLPPRVRAALSGFRFRPR